MKKLLYIFLSVIGILAFLFSLVSKDYVHLISYVDSYYVLPIKTIFIYTVVAVTLFILVLVLKKRAKF